MTSTLKTKTRTKTMKMKELNQWVMEQLPPLTWNILALKFMKSFKAQGFSVLKFDDPLDLPENLLDEIDGFIQQQYKKSLPR